MRFESKLPKRQLGGALLAGVILLVGLAGVLTASPDQQSGQTRVALPTATVEVLYFKKKVPEGQMMGSVRGAPPPEVPRYTVNYGEEITFDFTIKACKAARISATLSHAGTVELGTATTEGNCATYRSSKTVRITEGGIYTLHASGVPAGPNSTSEKSVEIVVKRYGLDMTEITFDPATRKLALFARNTGDLDIPAGEIQVNYTVFGVSEGHGPSHTFFEGQVNRSHTAVPRGQTVEFGVLHMPSDAINSYHRFAMRTEVLGEPYGFPNKQETFEFRWDPKESRINRLLLDAMIDSIVGDIRFNNYDPSKRTGEFSDSEPIKPNDSWIVLNGTSQPFNPPHIVWERYYAYINNILFHGASAQLILGPNRLGVRLPFETSGSREVKIFRYTLLHKYWDDGAPDLEFTNLVVDLILNVHWNASSVNIRSIEPTVALSASFAGGWGEVVSESIQNRLEAIVRDEVTRQVRDILNSPDIIALFNTQLTNLVNALHVSRIVGLAIDNDGVLIRYY